MKIAKFEIHSIRGIRTFGGEPNGESIVIAGPNGTGKSGVIDAMDFLFSGDIQRLGGPGTKSLSLDVHGKHIDDKVSDSYVTAVIQLGSDKTVAVKRGLASKKLELIKGDASDFAEVEESFASGQFQLTRRELLRFIVAEGKKRAEEIQELLDVSDLDTIRSELNAVVRSLTRSEDNATESQEVALKEVDAILQNKDASKRRDKVNEFRAVLKKAPITSWSRDTNIAADLEQPEATAATAVKRKEFRRGIDALQLQAFAVPSEGGKSAVDSMKEVAKELADIENRKEKLERYELLRLGLAQVADDGACPLCDTKWPKHDLIEHIKQKVALTDKLKWLADRFEASSTLLVRQLDEYISKFLVCKGHAKKIGNGALEGAIQSCIDELKARHQTLTTVDSVAPINDLLATEKGHIATSGLVQVMTLANAAALALPEESPEEIAYKNLLRVSTLFQSALATHHKLKELSIKKTVATKVRDAYEAARKKLFETLYDEVEKDFKEFYVFLNEDESTFKAKLDVKGAGVDLTVDFYGRGMFPPIALHSEGHQDSMGICLYLALMKRLKSDGFTIAMLDDVMMSIDSGHRRRLCQLLKIRFPNTQFIITTHDRIWARQLKEFQIVKKPNLFHFRTWSLQTGPVVDTKDAYEAMREYANKNEIVSAAANLRNNLEEELQEICALLKAKVVYQESQQWNPGELYSAAQGQFGEILKKAKAAANSWGSKDAVSKLGDIETRLKQKAAALKTDEWQINPAVHFNSWAQFTKGEMLATINGVEALISAFCCEKCLSKLFLAFQGNTATTIACHCGHTTHTLIAKP